MELESLYDGVAGWSGAGSNTAPLVAPGDSFVVTFTPPRAGTFIYHTHMDETLQLTTGMYGPLLVLEPGARFDPETDLVLMIGGAVDGDSAGPTINGRRTPVPRALSAGTTYRLRFINILPAEVIAVGLFAGEDTLAWTPVSKDGADVAAARRRAGPATFRAGVGETYDFEWTPAHRMEAELRIDIEGTELRRVFQVR
jgi:FtsP/CotA-like multicopper oxidase with cupredoxin domain